MSFFTFTSILTTLLSFWRRLWHFRPLRVVWPSRLFRPFCVFWHRFVCKTPFEFDIAFAVFIPLRVCVWPVGVYIPFWVHTPFWPLWPPISNTDMSPGWWYTGLMCGRVWLKALKIFSLNTKEKNTVDVRSLMESLKSYSLSKKKNISSIAWKFDQCHTNIFLFLDRIEPTLRMSWLRN